MPDRRQLTRRAALGLVAGGGLLAASETLGFSNVTAGRGVSVSTADDPNAIVGIELLGPVQKNSRDPMVDITNDLSDDATVTVSLNTCSDGTLYDPQGDSGCSVTFPLLQGNTGTVDIEAAVGNTTIPFTIDVVAPRGSTPTEFSFTAVREVTAETGKTSSAVTVKKVDRFSANTTTDDWSVGKVQVKDNDGDDDLDRVEYEITDSVGTTVATRTDSASGRKYQVNNITIEPDDSSYQVQSGETYTLTVTGYDVDGNSDTETKSDTA